MSVHSSTELTNLVCMLLRSEQPLLKDSVVMQVVFHQSCGHPLCHSTNCQVVWHRAFDFLAATASFERGRHFTLVLQVASGFARAEA